MYLYPFVSEQQKATINQKSNHPFLFLSIKRDISHLPDKRSYELRFQTSLSAASSFGSIYVAKGSRGRQRSPPPLHTDASLFILTIF